jgi:hypothetical protein
MGLLNESRALRRFFVDRERLFRSNLVVLDHGNGRSATLKKAQRCSHLCPHIERL